MIAKPEFRAGGVCDGRPMTTLIGGKDDLTLQQHVETCVRCQTELESWMGDGMTIDELGELLQSDPLDNELAIATDVDDRDEAVPRFLEPSDNPRFIGRFGRYDIVEVLGRGGMGVVLHAFDSALNRHCAVKVLAPELASSGPARKRFRREAKSAAAVVHPHVVPIQTVDQHDGLPYLVMPVIAGRSLQRRVDDDGPLAVVDAVRIASQIAEGLAAAHGRGLVHRDIKPANILLENGVERVQITDFGLARATDDASMTRSGVIAGTPQYMSPEQACGEPLDARSDLFSLGSVLYFMLSGRSPFRAETTMGVLRRIADDDPRPIGEVNPDVPHWLADIVHRLLGKKPSNRFASATEVADDLSRWWLHLEDPPRRDPPSASQPQTNSSGASGRPPWKTAIAGAMAFGFVMLAGILLMLRSDRGTLRIENPTDVAVPVIVHSEDHSVERLTVDAEGKTLSVRSGTYRVEIPVEAGTFFFRRDRIEIRRGEKTVMTIRELPPEKMDMDYLTEAASQAVYPMKIPLGNNGPRNPSLAGEEARINPQGLRPTELRNTLTDDLANGEHELALDKIEWLWRFGAKRDPAFSAVRRSFLIQDWLKLADIYPPAVDRYRQAILKLQNESLAEWRLRAPTALFADYVAWQQSVGRDEHILALFEKLRERWPKDEERLRRYLPNRLQRPDVPSPAKQSLAGGTSPVSGFVFKADVYQPPSSHAFFPNDPEAGKRLDDLFRNREQTTLSDSELLEAVRRGLRTTSEHRMPILRWIGNRYIWGQSPQNEQAIELMYHAADNSNAGLGTTYDAVYFGLSVIEDKPDNVLQALASIGMTTNDHNTLGRIAWGCSSQKDELISYLQPNLESETTAIREKAEVCRKIFSGQWKAGDWAAQRAKVKAELEYGDQRDTMFATLTRGDSPSRLQLLRKMMRDRIPLILDDKFQAAFTAAVNDESPEVRDLAVILMGMRWNVTDHPETLQTMMRASKDPNPQVRYNAVYYGLSNYRGDDDAVGERLVEMATNSRDPNLQQRIHWGLRTQLNRPDLLKQAELEALTSSSVADDSP